MDNDVVMKNHSDMNDEGEDGEANSELEARLYAEIYYSNEISDKVSPSQKQYGITTINDVKNRWKNITDTPRRIETSNPPINSQTSQDTMDELQPTLRESFDSSRNTEVYQVDENNSNLKGIHSENSNKNINSKKGTPKKRKSLNVESVASKNREETNVRSSDKASREKKKQVQEPQSECEPVTNIIHNDNTGTEVNKSNKTPRYKKTKVGQNEAITPSKQISHNNKQQAEECVSNETTDNERIISENAVRSDPSGSLNSLEEATEKTSSSTKRGTSKSKKKNSKSANLDTSSSNIAQKETSKSKKSKKQSKQSKQKDDNNTAAIIMVESSESSDTTPETHSKYKVSSKKNKMKKKQCSKDDNISDSDDSILEVPVPRKPTPPLINLQDSDDECENLENLPDSPANSSTNYDQSTAQEPVEIEDSESLSISDVDINETVSPTGISNIPESSSETTSPESTTNNSQPVEQTQITSTSHAVFETTSSESSNDSESVGHTVLDDTALQTNTIARLPGNVHSTPEDDQPVIESEEDNIILNCTGIQRGASSIEEIKNMSGTAMSKQVSCCDDSMTESEANNWNKLVESRKSLNTSETALSCAERVSISEIEVTTDNTKNLRHKKSKSRKSSDNNTKEFHDADKENNISEFSGDVSFNFQEESDDQEENRTDLAGALMEDAEVHLQSVQGTSTEKNNPIIIHTPASNKEKSPSSKKRSSDTTIGPSTSSKQARYSDPEAGPSSAGLDAPKKKNVEKSNGRNCAADYFFIPMSNELKTFYNESWGGENFDMQQVQSEMPRDPRHWAILDADLCNPMKKQRYWSNIKCKQCHSEGHNKASCPNPKKVLSCHMCGKEGHTEPRCPEKKCLTCGKATSSYVKTCGTCRKLKCATCGSKGHEKSMCPDLWRRFHRTTNALTVSLSNDGNRVMKPAKELHCCNCAKRGHDYKDCVKYRWSQHFPTPSYVTNYTDGPHYISNTENDVIEIIDESIVSENDDRNADVNKIDEKNEPKLDDVVGNDIEMEEESVIYSYTSRHVIKNPEMWYKKWDKLDEKIRCIVDEGTIPLFIEDVAKMVPLEFTITTGINYYLLFTLRCEKEYCESVHRIIFMWASRDDVDKNHFIFKELPLQKSEMIHLLSNKLNETKADFGDPLDLLNEIQNLKKQVRNFYKNGTCNTQSKIATTRLTKLESKLVMCLKFQTPKGPNGYNKSLITKVVNNLRSIESKTVPTGRLLEIALLFNKFFGHFIPIRAEKLANQRMKMKNNDIKTQGKKSKKKDKNNKKGTSTKALRRNPERAARYNLNETDVNQQNSASISNTEINPTNVQTSCSGDIGNLSYPIMSDTPNAVPSTSVTPAHPTPSLLDIHVAQQLLLPLPSLLKNPCNVNFMSNNFFVRPDNIGQENFLPLETVGNPHNDNNNPYNVPAQNPYQDGPSTGIGSISGVRYQPFGALGIPYESHLNNMHAAPYQLYYYNAPQNPIQANQFSTNNLTREDFTTDDVIWVGNIQGKNNAPSIMQMQHQNAPANVSNTAYTKSNEQPILTTKASRRKERIRQAQQNRKNQKKIQNTNYTINKAMRKKAKTVIREAKYRNIPKLTAASRELAKKLHTGVMTKKDISSLNRLISQFN